MPGATIQRLAQCNEPAQCPAVKDVDFAGYLMDLDGMPGSSGGGTCGNKPTARSACLSLPLTFTLCSLVRLLTRRLCRSVPLFTGLFKDDGTLVGMVVAGGTSIRYQKGDWGRNGKSWADQRKHGWPCTEIARCKAVDKPGLVFCHHYDTDTALPYACKSDLASKECLRRCYG